MRLYTLLQVGERRRCLHNTFLNTEHWNVSILRVYHLNWSLDVLVAYDGTRIHNSRIYSKL